MAKQPKQQHAAPVVDDDPVPENIEDFRLEMARRISRFLGDRKRLWLRCPEPVCKRHRSCAAPQGRCAMAKPPRPMTQQEEARMMAAMQRAIRAELVRRGIEP